MDQVAAETLARHDGGGDATTGHGSAARDSATVLGVYLALGLFAALLWWLVVDPAMFTRTRDGGLSMGEVELAEQFNGDGWYTVIAAVLGMLSGAALTWWKSRDPLLTVGLVAVGSGLAAAVMAWLGGLLGPADPAVVHVAAGTALPAQLEVASPVCYLAWPIAALIGSLLMLWSPPAGTSGP